jgi:hypothetical protein
MSTRIRVPSAALLAAAQVGAVLALIEWRHPFFFLQDDNRNFVLPFLAHNWRAMCSGEIAQFNFFQFCGMPALANGQAEALYPPAYLATALSRLLFGSASASVDFMVAFHLLLGAVGAWFCFRELGLSRAAAAWAGSAAVLNAFVIYVGDSWPGVSAAAAYLPWALGFALRFAQGRKWAATGLAISNLLWFLNGYPQLLLYGAVFETVFFLVAVRGSGLPALRAALAYAGNWIVTGLLAAPLLLPMAWQMTTSAGRASALKWQEFASGTYSPLTWFAGVVYPFSARSEVIAYIGLPVAALVFLGAPLVLQRKPRGGGRAGRMLAVCALAAFLWSLGAFSPVLYHVPVFNRLRWPFKLQLFTAFFLAGFAGWALDRIMVTIRLKRPVLCLSLLFVLTLVSFAALYAGSPVRASTPSAGPPPALEPLADSLKEGRTVTVGYRDYSDRDGPEMLGFDYPTMRGIQAFGGYDPFFTKLNSEVALGLNHMSSMECGDAIAHLEYLRSWAVSYYVVNPATGDCTARLTDRGLTLLHADPLRRIFKDGQAAPLVSWESGDAEGIGCVTGVNAVECRVTSPAGGRIRMRYAAHPFFFVTLDGKDARFSRDRRQVLFSVPPGEHAIELRYRDPFFEAGWKIALATLLAVAAYAFLRSAGRVRPLIPAASEKARNLADKQAAGCESSSSR